MRTDAASCAGREPRQAVGGARRRPLQNSQRVLFAKPRAWGRGGQGRGGARVRAARGCARRGGADAKPRTAVASRHRRYGAAARIGSPDGRASRPTAKPHAGCARPRGTATGPRDGTIPRGAATGPDHGTVRRDGDIAPYRQAARGVRTAMGYGNGTTRWGMAMRAHNMGHGNGGEWQRDCIRGRMANGPAWQCI